jgi:uncharacterized protein with PQ loop repeat
VVLVDCACSSPTGLSGTTAAVWKLLWCVYVPQHFSLMPALMSLDTCHFLVVPDWNYINIKACEFVTYYLSPMFNEFYECINTVPLTPHFICFSNFSGSCYLFYEIFFCYYTMCCVTKSQIIAFPCSIIMMYPVEYHYAVYAKFIVFSASTNLLHLWS